ncbi:MAG: ABC transporter substrate-binding protein, partial [Proteobacteria bacterium]|nr:ABC transporter substrate-binding protein [Pseudomonadota bacterium]
MQNFLFPLIIFIISLALTTCQKKTLKVITVTQIIEHPSLDQERSSFIETLSNLGFGDTIKIIFENAHGNMTTAVQIAQKFSGLKPDVMVAFSTPSAQSLAKISQEKGIPLIFSSVTDPQQAHLAQSPWITGISDGLSAVSQIKFIQTLFPFLKKIGIIYN